MQSRAKEKYIPLGFLFQVSRYSKQHIPQTRSQGQRLRAISLVSCSLIQYLTWIFNLHDLSLFIRCYIKYSF